MRPHVLLFPLLAACASTPDPADGWVEVGTRHGIRISARGVEEHPLPRVRGEAEIEAGVLEVLAVLSDIDRAAEWTPQVVEAHYLDVDGGRTWAYQRGRAPLPANLIFWDRDVVLRSELIEVEPGELYRATFEASEPDRVPVPRGVVRVPLMHGHAVLTARGEERSHLLFEVEMDTGGAIPETLQVFAVQELPFDMIRALRERVETTRGQYDELIAGWRENGVDLGPLFQPGAAVADQ